MKSTKYDFVDKILERTEKDKVLDLLQESEGKADARSIAKELNISQTFCQDVLDEMEEKAEARYESWKENGDAPY